MCVYSFNVVNPGDQPATYELAIGKVISLNERLQREPWSYLYPSPRIQTLRTQIAAGQANTDHFWKQWPQRALVFIKYATLADARVQY